MLRQVRQRLRIGENKAILALPRGWLLMPWTFLRHSTERWEPEYETCVLHTDWTVVLRCSDILAEIRPEAWSFVVCLSKSKVVLPEDYVSLVFVSCACCAPQDLPLLTLYKVDWGAIEVFSCRFWHPWPHTLRFACNSTRGNSLTGWKCLGHHHPFGHWLDLKSPNGSSR